MDKINGTLAALPHRNLITTSHSNPKQKVIAYQSVEVFRNNIYYIELLFKLLLVVKLQLLQKDWSWLVSHLFCPAGASQ